MRSLKQNIGLDRARAIAESLRETIAPFCERFAIAGSVRRKCLVVHDLDVVIIPKVGGIIGIVQWARQNTHNAQRLSWKLISAGQTHIKIMFQGIPVDIYFAYPDTWVTILLIRTGSALHNIQLCARADKMGYCIHADGRGLFTKKGEKLQTDSEEQYFEQLGLHYKPPEERSL